MHHLEHPYRPPAALAIMTWLLAALTAAVVYHRFGDLFSDSALLGFCSLYGTVVAIWVLGKAVRPGPRNWLSPDGIFLLVFTVFHLPYVFFYLIGLADYTQGVFWAPGATNRAMLCVVLTAAGFLIGYEVAAVPRRQPAQFHPMTPPPPMLMSVLRVVLILTALFAAVALAVGLGPVLLTYGYGGFRRMERYVGPEGRRWIGVSLIALRIAVILTLAACLIRYRRILRGAIVSSVVIIAIVFFLLVGARSEVAMLIIPVIVGRHYFVRRIRLRWGIPLLIGTVLLFGVVGIGRQAESLAPGDVLNAYRTYREETGVNPFVASLVETGASFKTVNVACAFIPSDEPYWIGRSLWHAALMLVPAPIAGLRGEYLAPSAWVTLMATGNVGGETAGWGSSIAMEAYMNFGLAGGMTFMIVVGFAMRSIYESAIRKPDFLRIVLVLIAVSGLALWCRNYSHHFIRPVGWTMLTAWIVWSPFARRSAAPEPVFLSGTGAS